MAAQFFVPHDSLSNLAESGSHSRDLSKFSKFEGLTLTSFKNRLLCVHILSTAGGKKNLSGFNSHQHPLPGWARV